MCNVFNNKNLQIREIFAINILYYKSYMYKGDAPGIHFAGGQRNEEGGGNQNKKK